MAVLTDGRIVKNFSLTEMANNKANEDIKLVLTPEMIEHAIMMQRLRDWYGKALNVSSWYRTPSFNKSVGGDAKSVHLDGRATDIDNIPESLYDEFTIAWRTICSIHGVIGGANYYEWGMHFDSHEDKFGHTEFVVRDYRKEKGND